MLERTARTGGLRGLVVLSALLGWPRAAWAGPETLLREFAGGQVKKGVRTIGMGGDGATTGNYALVYKDAGGALFDQGFVRFRDTGDLFTFSALGLTTPTFWEDAAFYVIALAQQGESASVWTETAPNPRKPPSVGNLTDTSVFVKFAKPLGRAWSIGLMGAFESSEALLRPYDGSAPIHFATSYLPSGGAGLHWHPNETWQAGLRVIVNHDNETRTQAATSQTGLLRSYEYRLGVAYSPWAGTLVDLGADALDRSNAIEGTSTFDVYPTVGAEQALVRKRVWVRAGVDETTYTTGLSVAIFPVKVDLAYLYNLAAARTQDVFGKRNTSLIATINLQYDTAFWKR